MGAEEGEGEVRWEVEAEGGDFKRRIGIVVMRK